MALPYIAAGGGWAGAAAGGGAAAGALLTNPVGWLGLGASLLMSLDAQDQANAQRTEAYNKATSNLMMERDQRLQGERTKVLAAQDQIVEQKLQNMLTAMQETSKVKASAKGQMSTGNLIRLIKSGELQGNTRLNEKYKDMINAYDTNAENIFKRTRAEIERLANEYATQDNTLPLLFNTVFQGMQMHQLDMREAEIDEINKNNQKMVEQMLDEIKNKTQTPGLSGKIDLTGGELWWPDRNRQG